MLNKMNVDLKNKIIETYKKFNYSDYKLAQMFNVSQGSANWIIRSLKKKCDGKNLDIIYKDKHVKKRTKETKIITILPVGLKHD
jgi:transposase